MAKPRNRQIDADAVASPEAPASVASPIVTVRARVHLGEFIGGEMTRFAPGQTFQIDAARAASLGPLVEVLPA